MDKELWEGCTDSCVITSSRPGMAHYWKLRPEVFSARFRKFVDSLAPPVDQRTVGTLFKQ